MDGVHDMGGMDNFGPIIRENNEPVFHSDWERAVFGNMLALLGAGHFSIDEIRRSTEQIPPVRYLSAQYYEKWLESLLILLVEKGVLTPEEIEQGKSLRSDGKVLTPFPKESAEFIMNNPVSAKQDIELPSKFKVGDLVMTKVMSPLNHTRLPRYARGKCGVIEKDHGVFLLPDTNGHGGPSDPQHTYGVRFQARDLWGEDAPPKDTLYLDLFESYMEHA